MKRNFRFLVVALPLVLIIGCDLAKFPIDDPANVKIDTRLLGKWKSDGKKSDMYDVYNVSMKDSLHYMITATSGKHKDKHIDTVIAFLSEVRNARLLNVKAKEHDTATGYLFIQILDISPDGKKITLATVKDTSMKYMVSAPMIKEHIYNNLNDPDFYGDTVHMRKIK